MLSRKVGFDVSTPYGARKLCDDIFALTGEKVSLNTIKRLTGILSYDSSPREITMNIIAAYLGFPDWTTLELYLNNKISEFNTESGFIDLSMLPVGQEVQIEWLPDRKIRIRHDEGNKYRVVESLNSKLETGDILKLSQIAVGFPFIVGDVQRNNQSLGNYTAAPTDGITKFLIL